MRPQHTSVFIAFVYVILFLMSSEWAMRDLLQILLHLHVTFYSIGIAVTNRWNLEHQCSLIDVKKATILVQQCYIIMQFFIRVFNLV